ncbi:ATP-binding cassette sub-family A member 3-like [Aplysia californica]|uniref:ATP-binding cassette sub-family A member 3-like n=1 Tax=Aplysia californica TaxID=6500 RepID=A0ABM1W170_APLCA|nr:ATP-binding cassette sub-family A member 3-like [Aplysia californica]
MKLPAQVKLILWKNFVHYKRRKWMTLVEILLPSLFAMMFVVVRELVDKTEIDYDTFYKPNNTVLEYKPISFNLSDDWIFGYVPSSPIGEEIVNRTLEGFRRKAPWAENATWSVRGFETDQQLLDFYRLNIAHMPMCFKFHDVGPTSTRLGKTASYAIRPTTMREDKWQTDETYPLLRRLRPEVNDLTEDDRPHYRDRAVLFFIRLVDEAIISHWGGKPYEDWTISTHRMPYPPYVDDEMTVVIQQQLALYLVMSFILTVVQFTKSIVYEKEKRLKESMKLMGLKSSSLWISWFLTSMLFQIMAILIYSAIMKTVTINPIFFLQTVTINPNYITIYRHN